MLLMAGVLVLLTAYASPQIILEYQPVRPFYHPNPGNYIKPIIPPGKPWPDSQEGYQNFGQYSSPPSLEDRLKETTTTRPTTTRATQRPETISLEYQPNRPFHHSNPGNTLSQIVPPGKPWPDSAEGYQNFSGTAPPTPSLANRIETTSSTTTKPSNQGVINLEYQPNRPSFHPNPGDKIQQIVPPGKPWPSSPEDYQNFSQITSASLNLTDRIKDTTTPSITSSTTQSQNSVVSLEYQPNRPWYHPNPGDKVSQVVPPGKPWPDSAAGYENFGQNVSPPNIQDRVKETTTVPSGFIWETDDDLTFGDNFDNVPDSEDKTPSSATLISMGRPPAVDLGNQPGRPVVQSKPDNMISQTTPWPVKVPPGQNVDKQTEAYSLDVGPLHTSRPMERKSPKEIPSSPEISSTIASAVSSTMPPKDSQDSLGARKFMPTDLLLPLARLQ